MILIYTTHKNKEEAQKITEVLLKEKLIACANYIPIESCYAWKNKIKNETELVALYKTQKLHFEAVTNVIEDLHSYETPCIIKIEGSGNQAFENWVVEST